LNTNLISQGLSLSLVGLVLVFASILILIAVIYLIDRLFRPKPEVEEPEPQEIEIKEIKESSGSEDLEIAAVIAAALMVWQEQEKATDVNLGLSLETPPGSWWTSNRMGIKNITRR